MRSRPQQPNEVTDPMQHTLSRREVLTGTAGAAAVALAGCVGGEDGEDELGAGSPQAVEAYVVAYHWGYAAFDDQGEELELIEIPSNTELTIHAVNDHAYDAFDALPDPVAAQLEDFDALARTTDKVVDGHLRAPSDGTVEDVYEEAHGHGNDDHGHDDGHHGNDDHGHDDDHHGNGDHGHDDGHHGNGNHDGGQLDHGFRIRDLDIKVPADADEPTTASTVFTEPGTYEASCTVPCGYYHGNQRQDLVRVTDDA